MAMHIVLYEPFSGGHHSNYIEVLLPSLIARREAGDLSRLTVVISEAHRRSASYAQQLARFEGAVDFDIAIRNVDPAVPVQERLRLSKVLTDTVKRLSPDVVVLTTADHDTLVAAFRPGTGVGRITHKTKVVAMVHAGYAGQARSHKDRVKDAVYRFALRRAPWQRVLLVNPLNYEWASAHGYAGSRLGILPDPVSSAALPDPLAARHMLGLPTSTRIVGHVGTTDGRKAIPELLAAFRTVSRPGEKLLLAGMLDPEHRSLIASAYRDLVADGRIILFDRYLGKDELTASFAALDLAAPLHHPRAELSANFLKGVMARRPVFADAFGYTGAMIERFALGISADVRDAGSVASGLRRALDLAPTYVPSAGAERLIAFHAPANFIATVAEAIGLPSDPSHARPIRWEGLSTSS